MWQKPKQPQSDKLPDNAAWLEYFVGDSSVYVFTLTANELQAFSLPKDTALHQQVSDMWQALMASATAAEPQQAYRLYYDLLEIPIPLQSLDEGIIKLVIIPAGALTHIPFDVLLTQPAR